MIDWENIKHFSKWEFSEDPDFHAEPQLIETLDAFREIVGKPIYPSREKGALARFEGTNPDSRHYAVGRKSDAIDVFVEGDIRDNWMKAFCSKLWGGIGIYFDTHYKGHSWPMLHLDLRQGTTTYWYRVDKQYGHPILRSSDLHRMFGLLNAI
jgi:hypothetical protein